MNKLKSKDTDVFAPSIPKALLRGLLVSMIFTFVAFAVFALIISLTSLTEASADKMVTVCTGVAIAISGFTASKGAMSKGWLWGALGGLLYITVVWIIGMISSGRFYADMRIITMLLLAALIGAFGGIIGINTKR